MSNYTPPLDPFSDLGAIGARKEPLVIPERTRTPREPLQDAASPAKGKMRRTTCDHCECDE